MRDNYFDEDVAATYDERLGDMADPEVLGPTVDFLAAHAGGGHALEFAIGTGRVGLPLSQRGVLVHGIEMSEAMIHRLRAKPGAENVAVTTGDMATTQVSGRFQLVYLVFNTISNLLTQQEQVQCFRNAAAHLEPGGRFVVEVFVPDLQRLPPGETARPFHVGQDHLGFDTFDLVNQRLVSHHFWVNGDRVDVSESPHRYVWPSELDLMASLAGMRLRERWSDWSRAPFTADSRSHISVWEKQAGDPELRHAPRGREQPWSDEVLDSGRVVVVTDNPIARAVVEIARIAGRRTTLLADEEVDQSPLTWLADNPLGPRDSLVLCDHDTPDADALLRLGLDRPTGYVAMMGSRRRAENVLSTLAESLPANTLARLRIPAGLNIGGKTPGEIALSVVAEIVAVSHGRDGGPMKADGQVG